MAPARLNELRKSGRDAYCAVIDKLRHRARYTNPWNPYEIAMQFCLEKLSNRLVVDRQRGRLTHILFEARGREEDRQLEWSSGAWSPIRSNGDGAPLISEERL